MTQLDADERRTAAQIAEKLDHGFAWSATPQGFAYWQRVWKELMIVANPDPPAHSASTESTK